MGAAPNAMTRAILPSEPGWKPNDGKDVSWEMKNGKAKFRINAGGWRDGHPYERNVEVEIGLNKRYSEGSGNGSTSCFIVFTCANGTGHGIYYLDIDIDTGVASAVHSAVEEKKTPKIVIEKLKDALLELQTHVVSDQMDSEGRIFLKDVRPFALEDIALVLKKLSEKQVTARTG